MTSALSFFELIIDHGNKVGREKPIPRGINGTQCQNKLYITQQTTIVSTHHNSRTLTLSTEKIEVNLAVKKKIPLSGARDLQANRQRTRGKVAATNTKKILKGGSSDRTKREIILRVADYS